jgi:hypothetical protein
MPAHAPLALASAVVQNRVSLEQRHRADGLGARILEPITER